MTVKRAQFDDVLARASVVHDDDVLSDEVAAAQDIDLDAYLSAGERAQKVEHALRAVAALMAVMTAHLYKTDRASFDRHDQEVQTALSRVDAMLVGLRMAVKSEYAPTPWYVRAALWCFAWIAQVRKVHRATVLSRKRHEALSEVAAEYGQLCENHREQIHDIRYAEVNALRDKLVAEDKEYSRLLKDWYELAEELDDMAGSSYTDNHREAQIRAAQLRINQKTEAIQEATWKMALREFGDRDF